MDINVIYEMNPPKVLYNNHFDNDTINKNIDLFLSRTKLISEYVDGIHLTDNVLVSSCFKFDAYFNVKTDGDIETDKQTCTCRLLRQESYFLTAICHRGYSFSGVYAF